MQRHVKCSCRCANLCTVPALRPLPCVGTMLDAAASCWRSFEEPLHNMLAQVLHCSLVIQEVRCLRSFSCSKQYCVHARWSMLSSVAPVLVAEQNPSWRHLFRRSRNSCHQQLPAATFLATKAEEKNISVNLLQLKWLQYLQENHLALVLQCASNSAYGNGNSVTVNESS